MIYYSNNYYSFGGNRELWETIVKAVNEYQEVVGDAELEYKIWMVRKLSTRMSPIYKAALVTAREEEQFKKVGKAKAIQMAPTVGRTR
jgi:hypothetical protein